MSLDVVYDHRSRPADRVEDGKRVPAHILEQLEPGTSMGGARPKATIEDGDRLWVGKFPERSAATV